MGHEVQTTDLASAWGFIGFCVRAKFLRREVPTFSVWEDEGSPYRFVGDRPREAMADPKGRMGPTRFERWQVSGREVPLR